MDCQMDYIEGEESGKERAGEKGESDSDKNIRELNQTQLACVPYVNS